MPQDAAIPGIVVQLPGWFHGAEPVVDGSLMGRRNYQAATLNELN